MGIDLIKNYFAMRAESRARFGKGHGDEGFPLTDEDEKILDRIWREEAERRGVVQLPLTDAEMEEIEELLRKMP